MQDLITEQQAKWNSHSDSRR